MPGMDEKPYKSPQFQFGLRTLFGAMAVVAVLSAMSLERFSPSQDAIVAAGLATAYVFTVMAMLYLDPSR
jgi:hypothetical protein